MTVERVLPLWHDTISHDVRMGKRVLIVSHMNSLRALVKYLSNMSEQEISKYNLPTATPLVYEFDENMNAQKSYFDIDP